MSVDDAAALFRAHPGIAHPLQLLQEVGLGYLSLGQPSPTLSGGEAQRIKLVTELARLRPDAQVASARAAFYILDEPTVGLHMADVERLIAVLHRLADAGNTVLVVEHNLDVIAEADWIIDLGPEAGPAGGRVVVAGPPAKVATHRHSRTGAELTRRQERCRSCDADLHACRLCRHFNPRAWQQCNEPSVEEVRDKTRANFCDHYQPVAGAWKGGDTAGADAARSALDKLFSK
jgi:ABC-type multidrug transport system ATPase subunit